MSKTNLSLVVVLSLSGLSAAFAQVNAPQVVAGEYIVKFRQKTSVSANLKAVSAMGKSVSVKNVFSASKMMHVRVSSESGRDALYSNPDVEFIEPNYILSVNPVEVGALGSAPDQTDRYTQSNAPVRVRDSWDIQKPYDQGSKTIVAVIDTGLDRNHNVFKDSGSIWENTAEKNGTPGVDDDGNGYVDDINGWNYVGNNGNVADDNNHGTHVAGIVLGVGQDVFANPVRESKIKILPLKFLDSRGSGSTANAVSAIYYAVAKGAKVINNSWGGPSYSQALHEAYAYAYNNGVVIVSAAGNETRDNDTTPMFPSNLDSPNNISVASTTDSDLLSSFSNYGDSTVNVAAPGSSISSTVPGTGCWAPGCFRMMSGTSMAAPFVAGVAALIAREAPQLSAYQIKAIVEGSLDQVAGLSGRVMSGGRVNSYKAILAAKAQSNTPAWTPAYVPDYKATRGTASSMESAPAAGCGLVKALVSGGGAGGAGAGVGDLVILLAVFMMPLVVALSLRQKTVPAAANRRVHERYSVAKQAVLQAAGQMISVTTEDVSVGGISFKSDAGLEKGQILQVHFGDSEKQVDAEVVWCSTKQEYGLKFLNVSDNVKFEIQSWTRGLVPMA